MVSSEYMYPLSKKDITKIKEHLPDNILNKISSIRFGCNTKTTQEGRIVQRGALYDIRINFCLNNLRSLLLSNKKRYLDIIRKFGGDVDLNSNLINWKLYDAKRYTVFILLHEIGHLVFYEKHMQGQPMGSIGSKAEEQWCENYAMLTSDKISI